MLYVVIEDAAKLACTIEYMKSRDEARYWDWNLQEVCNRSGVPVTLVIDDKGELRKKYSKDDRVLTRRVVPRYVQSGWSIETADVVETKPATITIDGHEFLRDDVERLLKEVLDA